MLVFGGSLIGSVWMMSVFGIVLPFYGAFPFHAVLQMDGFLTLLIMGIGYMIVPRFRNVVLPSRGLAYASLLLVLFSIAAQMVSGSFAMSANAARLAGVAIFAGTVLWMLRIHPKLLRLSDYFTGLSVVLLAALAVIRFASAEPGRSLTEVQVLLLFPILMIFGVEYKTLPSFLGFIRPRKKLAISSRGLAAAAVALGITSISVGGNTLLDLAFNATFLASAILFAGSLFIFGGFDNREILSLISGEKKARYVYTVWYTRLSFGFLYAAAIFAICYHAFPGSYTYFFFDLAVHYAAIGFIGITITLYLPLMLPPITGRTVHFVRLNHAPIMLIVSALLMRAFGDLAMASGALEPPASFPFAVSGWLVVAALSVFIVMVHRSMKGLSQIDTSASQ